VQTLKRVLRYWAIALLIATAMTLFTGFQTNMQFVLRGMEMSFLSSAMWSMVIWFTWAFLAPFAVLATLRDPIEKGPALPLALLRQVLFAIAFIGTHAAIAASIMHISPRQFSMSDDYSDSFVLLLAQQAHWALMSYLALVLMVHVVFYVRRAQSEALAREELRTQAAAAQLTALARQMQPHFLFNALNALVSMLEEGSPPQVFTIRLADMLRTLLHGGDRATASLGEELALVDAYLEIERARLGSRLRTQIDVAQSVEQCRLPAFILQPLVENAITHGISRNVDGGQVALKATRQDGEILIEISNTCAASNGEQAAESTQLTIPNCRRRLALMYGAAARFDASFVTRNLFRASIILPGDVPAALQAT